MSLFRLAITFLIIGLVAGMLGFGGIGASTILIAKLAIMVLLFKILFFIFIVLAGAFFVRHLFVGRSPS